MKRFLSVALLVSIANAAPAYAIDTISWDQLVDQDAQIYEDPYVDLTYDQLSDVRDVAVETQRLELPDLSEATRADSLSKLAGAQMRLSESGIDAQWLIEQRWVVAENREKAAVSVNPVIDGAVVSLGGFAIPAPPAEDGTQVVYLVPERGMCSHMPPPNPNQMIRARISGEWTPSIMHEPVRLTGTLTAEETNHVFRIVDGDVPMRASFIMNVEQVETMKDLRAHMRDSNPFTAHQSQIRSGADPQPALTE